MHSRGRPIIFAMVLIATMLQPAVAQATQDTTAFAQLYNAGEAAMAAGQYDTALHDFQQLETMDSSVAEVHATLGVLYYKSGTFEKAIDEIRTARKLKPGLPGLETLLALSLAESGHDKESLPGLEKAFRTSSDPALKRQAGLELSHVYTTLNMDRKAVEVALEMRDLYKNDPEVLYNVGKTLGNSAYLTMHDLFHSAGNSLWAQLAEAEVYESQGQFSAAIAGYKDVLAMNPHQVNIHYRMGRTYLAQWKLSRNQSDLQNAEAEFQKQMDQDPDNANAAYELADLRRQEGDLPEAQQLYQSAIRSYPNFEEAEVGLSKVLLQEDHPALALPHLQRATILRPDDEVAWYHLSLVERKLGNTEAQQQALARFQELHSQTAATLNSALSSPSTNRVTPQQLDAKDQSE